MLKDGGGWNPGAGAVEERGLSQDEPHTGDNVTLTQVGADVTNVGMCNLFTMKMLTKSCQRISSHPPLTFQINVFTLATCLHLLATKNVLGALRHMIIVALMAIFSNKGFGNWEDPPPMLGKIPK